jgi:hypothetical protein
MTYSPYNMIAKLHYIASVSEGLAWDIEDDDLKMAIQRGFVTHLGDICTITDAGKEALEIVTNGNPARQNAMVDAKIPDDEQISDDDGAE